jgi:hypothetical protein
MRGRSFRLIWIQYLEKWLIPNQVLGNPSFVTSLDDDVFQSIIETVHEICADEADHLERFQGKDFDAFLDDVYYPKLKSIYPSVFRSTLRSAVDVNTQHVRFRRARGT